jgi:two-component system sensor histidine kinase DctS
VVVPLQRQRPSVFQLVLPAQPMWIEGDALLLEHALLNLVSNAEHWAAQGSRPARVRVSVARATTAEPVVELEVADSGPGVPSDQRDQVFNAFFSAKDGGMGMGLAICRSVVEAHQGHIEVGTSTALGGASFRLVLPLIADAAEQGVLASRPNALPWSDLPGA